MRGGEDGPSYAEWRKSAMKDINNVREWAELLEKELKAATKERDELRVALEIASRQFRHAKNGNYPGSCIDGCAMCSVLKVLEGPDGK